MEAKSHNIYQNQSSNIVKQKIKRSSVDLQNGSRLKEAIDQIKSKASDRILEYKILKEIMFSSLTLLSKTLSLVMKDFQRALEDLK